MGYDEVLINSTLNQASSNENQLAKSVCVGVNLNIPFGSQFKDNQNNCVF